MPRTYAPDAPVSIVVSGLDDDNDDDVDRRTSTLCASADQSSARETAQSPQSREAEARPASPNDSVAITSSTTAPSSAESETESRSPTIFAARTAGDTPTTQASAIDVLAEVSSFIATAPS